MIDGKFCVRKAFIDIQRVSSYNYKRQESIPNSTTTKFLFKK